MPANSNEVIDRIRQDIGIGKLVWNSPESDKVDPDWEPLPDLFPHRGVWQPGVPRNSVPPGGAEGPLTPKCVKTLGEMWDGNVAGQRAGHPAHFHCYPITRHPSWQQWREHPNYPNNDTWFCTTIRNAAQHYSWTGYAGGTFEQLSAALQAAMTAGNIQYVAFICFELLNWGGVLNRSTPTVDWITGTQNLIDDIRDAVQALRPTSLANLNPVFGVRGIPMNSGSTKIFSAAALDFANGFNAAARQDVLLYDARVGAALGLLARRISPGAVIPGLDFPSGPANKGRNPSCGSWRFGNLDAPGLTATNRADYARTAARFIQQIIGTNQPHEDFVVAEKALFMIGYDVRTMCNKAPRPCP